MSQRGALRTLGFILFFIAFIYFFSKEKVKPTPLATPPVSSVPKTGHQPSPTPQLSKFQTSKVVNKEVKSKIEILPEKAYKVVAPPVSGTFALKIGERRVVTSFTQVVVYRCPKETRRRMCLRLPTGDHLVVSKELEKSFPISFKYSVRHF